MIILSGSSNQPLAKKIAASLSSPLADIDISKFPNGEKRVWVKSILHGKQAIIVQSFSHPVDEHIIELALIADACKHLGASQIIAVIPWLGYSPQDKEFRKGEPISIEVIARIIEAMGVHKLLTVDIHSPESMHYFRIPAYQINSLSLYQDHFTRQDLTDYAIVALDKGALHNSRQLSTVLNLPLVTFSKTRHRRSGAVVLKHKTGAVKGKNLISLDDFVSTGSTRIAASHILKDMGANRYIDCITHALLAADSPQKIQHSPIDTLIATDTYPIPQSKHFPKLKVISIAPYLADAIKKIVDGHTIRSI